MMSPIFIIFALSVVLPITTQQESFNTLPPPFDNNFSCSGLPTGFYADRPSNCRVYHMCDDQGNKFSYHCPEMTAFRQEAKVCDHAHLVDCEKGTRVGGGRNENRTETNSGDPANRSARPATPKYFGFDIGRFNFTGDTNSRLSSGIASYSNDNRSEDLDPQKTVGNTGKTNFIPEPRRNPAFFGAPRNPHFTTTTTTTRTTNNLRGANPPGGRDFDDGSYRPDGFEQPRTTTNTPRYQSYDFSRIGERRREEQNRREDKAFEGGATTTPSIFATSGIPLRDITASLNPLMPGVLAYDPYYPRETTTTEAYQWRKNTKSPQAFDDDLRRSSLGDVDIQLPKIPPDFDTFEDLVDRRRLFYIPRSNSL